MQVFEAFFKVLKSKIPLALIYIVIFVFLSVAMTLSDETAAMFEQTRLDICVFDEDETPESRALCDVIAARNNIVSFENDRDIVIDALYYGRADYVVTIKNGYAEKLAAGELNDLFESIRMHDSYSTVYMGQFLNEYVSTVSAYTAGGFTLSEAVAKAGEDLLKEAEVSIAHFGDREGAAFSPNTSLYFRFLAYVLIAVIMNTLCPVLLSMGRKDIRYRTDCSGIRPSSYTAQMFAGSIIYVLIAWLLFMIVGMFMNGGVYKGEQWLAVLNSFVFMLLSSALALFVASFYPSVSLINIITQVISLCMSFLCGVFVDQSMLGDEVLSAARFLPAYWYIRVNRMLDGTEVMDSGTVITAILIQAGFTVLLAILTVLVRKQRFSSRTALSV